MGIFWGWKCFDLRHEGLGLWESFGGGHSLRFQRFGVHTTVHTTLHTDMAS